MIECKKPHMLIYGLHHTFFWYDIPTIMMTLAAC